jgi:hypothetical protein
VLAGEVEVSVVLLCLDEAETLETSRMTLGDSALLWDRTVTRTTRAVETGIPPPFGQYVFAVGRVPCLRPAQTP